MADQNDQINQLLQKLEILLKRQDDFSREINNLKAEINNLKTPLVPEIKKEKIIVTEPVSQEPIITSPPLKKVEKKAKTPLFQLDLEKFIGENIINKIGIAITVIGVGIGAKYAIDHQLISPLTRIILGYLVGIGLLGFALRLRQKYSNFSAVLLSGAMAIMYFITYAAYSFYGLIPESLAFVLMVVFTVFTVIAAITYNQQVIAHIGLVGAYAVPFLLSDGSGDMGILFSYMAIINAGILFTAFKRYWKPLYYFAFSLTWLMYLAWFALEFQFSKHFGLAFTFVFIFFALFYLMFLAYKLLEKEKFKIADILVLLVNSFIFYSIGYLLIEGQKSGEEWLGLFTLGNALIHFIVSAIVYKQQLADRNVFYFVVGLVLVFITIAIPVQLDGNWVTLLWVGEAALLFWIGKTKNVSIYEKCAYPLMVLALFSIFHDWSVAYQSYYRDNPESWITPLFNIHFLSSLLFIGSFGFINFLHYNKKYPSALANQKDWTKILSLFLAGTLIFTTYNTFLLEIGNYWEQLFIDSALEINEEGQSYTNYYNNYDLRSYKLIWNINYSLLFVAALSFLNFKKVKNTTLGAISFGLTVLAILSFLSVGLYELSLLRESYLEQTLSEYYQRGIFNVGIRYVSFLFVALALLAAYNYLRQGFGKPYFNLAFDLLLYLTILWIVSSELIHWMDIGKSAQSYKLGLSILWGIYALLLIVLGIWKKKKHLRIGAIVLFGITLVKLFFYDITHLDTIAKTIVFVSLGILLLIISFLYTKYKHIIADEMED